MKYSERKSLKAIVAELEAAVSLDSIDANDLVGRISIMQADEEGELAELLDTAAFAVFDIEQDEDSEFADRIAYAVDAINEALDYRAPAKRRAARVRQSGPTVRWNEDGVTGWIIL